jgi:hypothetical protein
MNHISKEEAGFIIPDRRAARAMSMSTRTDIADHYWIIGGSTTDVYQSKTNTMVAIDDPAYVAWSAAKSPSTILNEAELAEVLSKYGSPLPAWLLAAPSFIQPTPDTYSPEQLVAYSENKRWIKEQGGLTLSSGKPIKTDDRAQAKINGSKLMAIDKTTAYNPFWHFADGSIAQLASTDVIAMSNDLQNHVENCFTISANNATGIGNGTITTLEQIDAAYA